MNGIWTGRIERFIFILFIIVAMAFRFYELLESGVV